MSPSFAKCRGEACGCRDACARFVASAVNPQTWIQPEWVWERRGPDFWRDTFLACRSFVALPAVPPHGGAPEEGDGA
jgi:hypothetical protein